MQFAARERAIENAEHMDEIVEPVNVKACCGECVREIDPNNMLRLFFAQRGWNPIYKKKKYISTFK